MPKLLVDEEGFRIAHDIVGGEDIFTLEQRDGDDAMGQPHWRRIETKSTRMLSLLYKYILKEKANAKS
jgi:hypothetical protein